MNGLTHLSLFTGIGGIDLAAEWAGFQTVGQVEQNKYANRVLRQRFGRRIPRWTDIRDLSADDFKRRTGLNSPTLISGGFPCQPFSCAGKRRGKEDDRHLWPEMFRVVRELRPAWVLGENVAGIINMELDGCLTDLENIGYSYRPFVIPACGVGALHRRARVFIVAYTNDTGSGITGFRDDRDRQAESQGGGSIPQSEPRQSCAIMAHSEHGGRNAVQESESTRPRSEGRPTRKIGTEQSSGPGCRERGDEVMADPQFAPPWSECRTGNERDADHQQGIGNAVGNEFGNGSIPQSGLVADANIWGEQRWQNVGMGRKQELDQILTGEYWITEPALGRVAHGVPHRVDRLRCLGNAVVPQQVYPILAGIAQIETEETG